MHPLRKLVPHNFSRLRSFRTFIIISLAVCILSVSWGQIVTAQTPVVSPSPSLEESLESPHSSPSPSPSPPGELPSPFPEAKSPLPTLKKLPNSSVEQSPEIQKFIQNFNVSPEEAQKLLKQREELDALGLFNLTSGRLGNLNYMAVKLDGRILFPIAANIQEDENRLKVRVQKIESTLNGIIKRNLAPDEIGVFPSILNNETVIVISRTNPSDNIDSYVRQRWILMTITAKDSQLYGISIPILSKIVSKLIYDALASAWEVRQPPFLLQQGLISLAILGGMIIASWGLLILEKYLVPRQSRENSLLWNRWLFKVGHAIIWFPGLGLILKGFPDSYEIGVWLLDNTFTISTAIISFLVIGRLLYFIVKFGESNEKLRAVPIRVFVQLFYILIAILFLLIIVANWVNQPLPNILAAVGAGSAILMLIFKDAITGFTAGLQLAANRMVSLEDWIQMPKYGADGFVKEVNLFTVKVLNWDNTITLIPTYALISDSFTNWRTVFELKRRKIQRAVYIDMSSIKFCDREMLKRFSNLKYVSEYIYEKRKDFKYLIERNQKNQANKSTTILENKWLTNIGIFRAYVTAYLQANPKISADPYFLVRQLQPTEHGLPIEIYVYCNDTAWAHYENVQADIFDHILSVVPEFDLRVFQSPSGYDLTELQISLNRKTVERR